VSAAPPGANGEMILTGFVGQFWAWLGMEVKQSRTVSAAVTTGILFMAAS
jgi:hypothetical protein